MVDHPDERAVVAMQHRGEEALSSRRHGAGRALVTPRLEPACRHHRDECQRDDRRNQDRDRQRHRELAKEAPDDVAHEQQRDQHGNERDRQRNDREADLRRARQRRAHRRLAVLDVARDVLDHHDRVVDDEAGRDRQRHQAQVVQAVAEQVHEPEAADQRDRHGDARDHRRARAAEKREDHQHDQHDRQQQLLFHVVDGCANPAGAISQHVDRHRRRQPRLQCRKLRLDRVDRRDHVRARLALHVHDDRGDERRAFIAAAVVPARAAVAAGLAARGAQGNPAHAPS